MNPDRFNGAIFTRSLFPGKKVCIDVHYGCCHSEWAMLALNPNHNPTEATFLLFNIGLTKLFKHLNSECYCISNTANLIAIANCYVDKFSLMSKNVITNLGKVEFDIKNKNSQPPKPENVINDIVQDPETNLTPFFNDKFTASNTNFLLEPLKTALKYYEYALKANKTDNYLSEKVCDTLKVLEMFNSLFQAFVYYDCVNYAFRTINLSLRYIKKFYKPKENELKEDVIINYCNAVRLHLSCGFFDNARRLYKSLFVNPAILAADVCSYGLGLKFLLYAEITLRCHKGNQIAKELKEFIQSEYLSKNTVKRFSLRAMAYFLASRFPSTFYEYSENCVEFVEPLQMAVSICRRWRLFNTFNSGTFEVEQLTCDPLWYKYTVFNLINDCFDTFSNFYVGTGILSDLGFYFRVVFNLNVLTLNFVGVARLQLVAANIDLYHGFISDAKVKISLFRSLFDKTSSEPEQWVFDDYPDFLNRLDSGGHPIAFCSSLNNHNRPYAITSNQCLLATCTEWDKVVNDEQKKLDVNLLDIYTRLVNDNKCTNSNDDINDLDSQSTSLKNSTNKQLGSFFSDEYSKINVDVAQYKSIFYLFYNLILIQLKVPDNQSTTLATINSSQYRFFLKLLENYEMIIYLPSIQLLVKDSIQHNLEVNTSIEEQIIHGPVSSLFWHLSSIFIEPLIEAKSYKEALFYLSKLVTVSAYSFHDRLSRCKMFYNRALVIYHLMQMRQETLGQNAPKRIFEICSNICLDNNAVDLAHTPPNANSKKSTKKKTIPKAPTRQLFASSAVKNYAESLLNAAVSSREGLEGTRRNVGLNFDEENPPTSNLFVESDMKVVKSTRKRAGRLASSNVINNTKNKEPFNLVVETAQRDSNCINAELISNFNNILKLNTADDFTDIEAVDDDSYFGKFFNLKHFAIETDISKLSVQELRSSLNKVINYICRHPSIDLYTKSMYLYFQFNVLTTKNNGALLYFFSESFPSASFRYRTIFVANKKNSLSKPYTYNLHDMEFTLEDYNWRLYDLPLNWRFVQIKVVENGTKFPDLMLCRYQYKAKTVFIKIQCNQEKMLKFFIDEFNEIMKANNTSIVEVVRETFWKLRFESDERLKLLLQSVETNWFGPFRGIFLGKCNDKLFTNACLWFKKKVLEAASEHKLECFDTTILDVLIESIVCLRKEEIDNAFKTLFNTSNSKFLTQISDLKKKYFKSWSTTDKVQELFSEVEPVGLILDTLLVQFPFESLPFIRELHQPFFRVPSLRFASMLYKRYKHLVDNGVDSTSSYYILNPSNNLASTESFFKNTLTSIEEWNGVIGQEPVPIELADALEKKEVYLYLGHGSGTPYYRKMPDTLDGCNVKAVSIVVGCSSGRINCEGLNTELYGVAYRFLVNGAPCYVGNLWDITDKDIDTFSDHFLSYWVEKWTSHDHSKIRSLPKSLSMARNYCKLKHLIGCAPVVYGLPLTRLINKQ